MNLTLPAPQTPTVDQLLAASVQAFQEAQFDTALAYCQNALVQNLDHSTAWNNGAAALARQGRYLDALAYVQCALTLEPYHRDATNNCAEILMALGQPLKAGAVFSQLGWHLVQTKQLDEAIKTYEQALICNPQDVQSWHVLAGIYSEKKNHDTALMLMNRALSIAPDHVATLAIKGNLLGAIAGKAHEAYACFEQALQIQPNHWLTLYNYGVFLAGQHRYTQAIEMYQRAIQVDPRHHLPYWNLSNLLLKLGDYARGWPLYEWRWKTAHLAPSYEEMKVDMPLWVGQDLRGKSILIHFEQGYGDAFQFIRFAKDIAARGARVTLFSPNECAEILGSAQGVAELKRWTIIPTGQDYHAPLMSLPAPLGLTIDNIPNHVPYLFASAHHLDKWRAWLPPLKPQQTKRIGLAWCGRITHDNDRNRSTAFAEWLPIIQTFTQVQFVSLQIQPRNSDLDALNACQSLLRPDNQIHDFSDTAALLTELDLLISVDTSVVHLAAALGTPVWALIPAASDWRWLLHRDDTPWYPNVRLFRQSDEEGQTHDWQPALRRVQIALAQELALKQ